MSRLTPACSGRSVMGFGWRLNTERTTKSPMTDSAIAAKRRSFLFIRRMRRLF